MPRPAARYWSWAIVHVDQSAQVTGSVLEAALPFLALIGSLRTLPVCRSLTAFQSTKRRSRLISSAMAGIVGSGVTIGGLDPGRHTA
jgi:hypothetical protein